MLRAILLTLLLAGAAQAQQLPPPPENPKLSQDDMRVVMRALLGVMTSVNDDSLRKRVIEIENQDLSTIGPTSLPIVGLALSRASKDPAACALLKKIEPSAVCVK